METKDEVLLRSLVEFYEAHPQALWKVTRVLHEAVISLRVLDWFVTNYAKRLNIVYPMSKGPETRSFNVYLEYRSMLKGYSKKYFDPFSRRTRVTFRGADGKDLETTLGQLNFFRWATTNGVLDYTLEHAAEVERDMLHSLQKSGRQGATNENDEESSMQRAKRRELSKAAIRSMTHTKLVLTLRFT